MERVAKLKKRLKCAENKHKAVTLTFSVAKEAMMQHTITPSQRQIVRYIMRPVLRGLEEKIETLKHEIEQSLEE